jgi:hypothetical protein
VSNDGTTGAGLDAPVETRVFMHAALTAGVEASERGDGEDTCPFPADGNRAERSARVFWLKGFRTP